MCSWFSLSGFMFHNSTPQAETAQDGRDVEASMDEVEAGEVESYVEDPFFRQHVSLKSLKASFFMFRFLFLVEPSAR